MIAIVLLAPLANSVPELVTVPLTITVPGDGWFGSMDKAQRPGTEKDKADFDYGAGSSRKNTTSYDTIFGKQGLKGDVKHYGQWKKGPNDIQDRGAALAHP